MKRQSVDPTIEVNGHAVYAVVEGFKKHNLAPEEILTGAGILTLKKGGSFEIVADRWYLQYAWLKVFDEITQKTTPEVLFDIGTMIPNTVEFPDWVSCIRSAVKSVDVTYYKNHRRAGNIMYDDDLEKAAEGIGHYGYKRIDDENRILSVCNTRFPCDFDRGVFTALVQKYEKNAKVTHLVPEVCRKNGDDACIYEITW